MTETSKNTTSYREIIKATSIFGGVQLFNIIISIIRSKLIAILLGTTGFGIMTLFNSTLNLFSSLTNLGIASSAVKDISDAYANDNSTRFTYIVSVFKKLVLLTGVFGFIIVLIFSSALSRMTFENNKYTISFIFLSVALLIYQLNTFHEVLLRATRQLKKMAKSNFLGNIIGVIISIPIYYIFGLSGIVPVIILTALVSLLINWFYTKRIFVTNMDLPLKNVFNEGREMLKLGFFISLSGFAVVVFSYLLRIYIGKIGGVEEVGLYNAGFSIVNIYVGMIFSAMASDYYPRLSMVSKKNDDCFKLINHQSEIAILILAPIILFF